MDAALNREEMLHSNPLLFSSDNGSIKRRLGRKHLVRA